MVGCSESEPWKLLRTYLLVVVDKKTVQTVQSWDKTQRMSSLLAKELDIRSQQTVYRVERATCQKGMSVKARNRF